MIQALFSLIKSVKFNNIFLLIFMWVTWGVCTYVQRYLWRLIEVIRSSEAAIIGGCELPDVDAGN